MSASEGSDEEPVMTPEEDEGDDEEEEDDEEDEKEAENAAEDSAEDAADDGAVGDDDGATWASLGLCKLDNCQMVVDTGTSIIVGPSNRVG
jgi:hypothetical protein